MKLAAILISALALGACGDDEATLPDDDGDGGGPGLTEGPREFLLRIENIAPFTVLSGGSQLTKTDRIDGPARSGEAFSIRFNANDGHFISFATMLGESNDWFFAPDPQGIPVLVDGVPTSGDVTRFVKLWDAGTELDQEPDVGDATGTRQRSRNTGAVDPDTRVREVPLVTRLTDGTMFQRPPITAMIRVTMTHGDDQQIVLRIENVSRGTTMTTSQGTTDVTLSQVAWAVHRQPAPMFDDGVPVRANGFERLAEDGQPDPVGTSLRSARGAATPLSPGVVVVHTAVAPLFQPGSPDFGLGLERLAEDGDNVPLTAALQASPPPGIVSIGEFSVPAGASAAGPAMPGQAFEALVVASPGEAVSFATMFGMSNDWLFATRPEGIALFHEEFPRSGDVTPDIVLYDLGTEVDELLDIGPNTAPQQPAPNTGRADRVSTVREVSTESYAVPEAMHLRVTLTPRDIVADHSGH